MANQIYDKKTLKYIKKFQQDEINSNIIYGKLSKRAKNKHNKETLLHISNDEKTHYDYFYSLTNKHVGPQRLKIWFYYAVTVIFGLSFGIRLMERSEKDAQSIYNYLEDKIPGIKNVIIDEEKHEDALISILDDERLTYISSIVLGLNDALVELTGALAGFTFSLNNSRLIALAGFIVGVSAALSMAASEFLSESEEESIGRKSPLKASIYTGISYLFVVLVLTSPYFLIDATDPLVPLSYVLVFAIIIILVFTYYITVAKNVSFKVRFFRMVLISMGVAFFSLILGLVAKSVIGVEI